MKDRLLIADLKEKEGKIITADNNLYFLVKKANTKTGKNNNKYIDLELTDGSASINGKVWDVESEIEEILSSGNIVKILHGKVAKYNDNMQMIIESAALVPQEELEHIKGIIPESELSSEELQKRWEALKKLLDQPYVDVVNELENSGRVWELFKTIPAGKSMHHANRRGLWEHAISVTTLAMKIADHYQGVYPINVQMIVAGAMLHDVGKVFEFQVNQSTSIVEKYSDRGRLLGHVYIGASFIEKMIDKAAHDDKDLKMELLHIMLSHHGEYEFGSPKKPKTMEALIVSIADNLDANLNAVYNGFQNDMEENWTKTIYSLQRPFYKTTEFE